MPASFHFWELKIMLVYIQAATNINLDFGYGDKQNPVGAFIEV